MKCNKYLKLNIAPSKREKEINIVLSNIKEHQHYMKVFSGK